MRNIIIFIKLLLPKLSKSAHGQYQNIEYLKIGECFEWQKKYRPVWFWQAQTDIGPKKMDNHFLCGGDANFGDDL